MSVRRLPQRWLSFAAFLSGTIPFAVGGHLVSESAAIGPHNLAAVLFASRHLYFIALILASFAALWSIGRGLDGPDRRTRIDALLRALPFGGNGLRFAGLTFGVQIAFFGATQILEGCPLLSGDVIAGLLTAILAAAVAALLLGLFERRLLTLALIATWISAKAAAPTGVRPLPIRFARFVGRRGAFLFSIANRPPPAAAVC